MDTKNIFNKIISLFLKVRLFILSEHNGLLVFQMPSCIFLEDLKKFLGFVYVGMWFSWVWICAHWPDYMTASEDLLAFLPSLGLIKRP